MKKKPRVLIDTFHLLNALTGIRTYTTQLCEGLESTDGLQAEYIFSTNWKKFNRTEFLRGKLNLFQKLANHFSFFLWKQLFLPIIIWHKGIDFVLCPDFVAPLLPMRARSLPVLHDTFFWEFRENYPRLWRDYFVRMIEGAFRKDTILIATSDYTRQKIRTAITDQHPIEVIYQAPRLSDIECSDPTIIQKFDLKRTPYFLHVGVFDRRKNLQLLVRAFNQFLKKHPGQYRLVLVGERGLGYTLDDFDHIVKLIRQLDLDDQAVLTGYVSNDQLTSLYQNAFAYTFPSLDEGFGIPVVEAMHHGIPLIVSDRGALQEVAANAALVFSANSEADLAEKLAEVTEPEVRKRLKEAGKSRVEQFGKVQFARQLDEVVLKYWQE